MFTQDFIGEILIPMKSISCQQDEIEKSLLNTNYQSFRSCLFSGEKLTFYVCIKSENLQNILQNIFVRIEFDLAGSKLLNEKEIINNQKDFDNAVQFFDENKFDNIDNINTSSLINNFNDPFSIDKPQQQQDPNENLNTDPIENKIILGDDKAILVMKKYISVPSSFVNKPIILKVHLLKKNYFMTENSLLKRFQSGGYIFNEEFTPIKTLFKELRVIRPVSISSVTQFDLSPDSSIIQFRFKNITNIVNFVDESLKLSKFLSKEKNSEFNSIGIDLRLNDCQVLKEESIIESKTVIDVKNSDQFANKEHIPFENFEFTIVNKSFPYILKAGEEFNLCIRINKTIDSYDTLLETISKDKELNEVIEQKFIPSVMKKVKVSVFDLARKTTITSRLNIDNNDNISRIDTESKFFDDRKSIFTQVLNESNLQGQFTNYNSNFNYSTSRPYDIVQSVNAMRKTDRGTIVIANTFDSNLKTQQSEALITQDFKDIREKDKKKDDQILKLVVRTPILLSISADKFYDSIYMNIPISWKTEISKFIRVEMCIKNKPVIHSNFCCEFSIKNLSSKNIYLEVVVSNNEIDNKIPAMLSEVKYKKLGELEANQTKILGINFLPIKDGFNELPQIIFIDRKNNILYNAIISNNIYVFNN